MQELAVLSSKATEQSRTHDAKVNALEDALHEKRRMEEQLNFAKDDLSIQVKRLEHQLNEKDSTVQVNIYFSEFFLNHLEIFQINLRGLCGEM